MFLFYLRLCHPEISLNETFLKQKRDQNLWIFVESCKAKYQLLNEMKQNTHKLVLNLVLGNGKCKTHQHQISKKHCHYSSIIFIPHYVTEESFKVVFRLNGWNQKLCVKLQYLSILHQSLNKAGKPGRVSSVT